jgi:molecular chaperone GrpE
MTDSEQPAASPSPAREGSVGVQEQGAHKPSPAGGGEGHVQEAGRQAGVAGVPAARGSAGEPEAHGPAGDEETEASEVAGDLHELIATAAQRDEYLALAQRTQADFENYRKRVARDSALAQERGVAKLAKELLPALDNFDRALEAAGAVVAGGGARASSAHADGGDAGGAQEDPLLDGVRLVRAELAAALTRLGIETFAPLGEPFDPSEQEAVAQQPVEGAQSGTVAEVYQSGYRLNGTVIRPARVLVAA